MIKCSWECTLGQWKVMISYLLAINTMFWGSSDEIKAFVEEQLRTNPIDVVLSHTCPFKYEPVEMFLSGVDQSVVDDSTERWLDKIEESIDYKDWFCGHWHTDKRIDMMHFLLTTFEGFEWEWKWSWIIGAQHEQRTFWNRFELV